MKLYEAMNGRKPNISFLHVFCCRCFIKNNRYQLTKFHPITYEAIFQGYSSKSKAYRVLNQRTWIIEESFDITLDDKFIQNSEPNHVTPHIMGSNAPPPSSPNCQTTFEFDFENLCWPIQTALHSESRSRPPSILNPLVSQNLSGMPTFPLFDFEVPPSQFEGENISTSIPQA